jgi:hypothetical protein
MRTTVLSICAACAILMPPNHAAAAPANADDPALQNVEALGNREPDRWQGRHHYLYDDEYQPGQATSGSAAASNPACASEPVRMRRADGTTVLRRLNRCD